MRLELTPSEVTSYSKDDNSGNSNEDFLATATRLRIARAAIRKSGRRTCDRRRMAESRLNRFFCRWSALNDRLNCFRSLRLPGRSWSTGCAAARIRVRGCKRSSRHDARGHRRRLTLRNRFGLLYRSFECSASLCCWSSFRGCSRGPSCRSFLWSRGHCRDRSHRCNRPRWGTQSRHGLCRRSECWRRWRCGRAGWFRRIRFTQEPARYAQRSLCLLDVYGFGQDKVRANAKGFCDPRLTFHDGDGKRRLV